MAKEKHILVVEDEEDIQQLVSYNLMRQGFRVTCADTGTQALELVANDLPDLVLLDLMLPEIGGLEVCRLMRNDTSTSNLPIIMLTAKGEEEDITAGLDLGADDYITKPFSPKVLVARVKALLRRRSGDIETISPTQQNVIKIDDLTIDPERHEVLVKGDIIKLTVTEFGILKFLASRPGRVFSRQQVIDEIHGHDYMITSRAVDVQVFGLRKKLGKIGELIETVRGIGYRFKE